jgi:hypothetical protein
VALLAFTPTAPFIMNGKVVLQSCTIFDGLALFVRMKHFLPTLTLLLALAGTSLAAPPRPAAPVAAAPARPTATVYVCMSKTPIIVR